MDPLGENRICGHDILFLLFHMDPLGENRMCGHDILCMLLSKNCKDVV